VANFGAKSTTDVSAQKIQENLQKIGLTKILRTKRARY
jgi:hypothetical protein